MHRKRSSCICTEKIATALYLRAGLWLVAVYIACAYNCSCFQRYLLIIIPPCTSDAATFITHGLHASRLSGCLLSHSIGLRVLQESGRNRSAEKSALLKMVPISTCSLTSNVAPYRRTWTSSAPPPVVSARWGICTKIGIDHYFSNHMKPAVRSSVCSPE